jgi:hypothetical protein
MIFRINNNNMVLTDGKGEEYSKALYYLNQIGVTVEPVERDVIE